MVPSVKFRVAEFVMLSGLIVMLSSCGGTGASTNTTPPPPASGSGGSNPPASAPQPGMVVMVLEENHSYEQVIGNSAMPYLNSLAQQGALATQYYAVMHPSLPNYFALTTGGTWTVDDNFAGPLTADNLAREISAAGKTWKSYAEDLPSPGYLGTTVGNYIKHHNPFAYFSDVVNDSNQAAKIVPFTQFAADLSAGALPAFSFVVPNALDDAHDCGTAATCSDTDMLGRADQWLKTNIAPVLSAAQFQKNGVLLIVFDESTLSDLRNVGGRVPLIAVGPKAKAGTQSAVTYNHVNTLKSVCEVLALPTCPGAAASVSGEEDLIQH